MSSWNAYLKSRSAAVEFQFFSRGRVLHASCNGLRLNQWFSATYGIRSSWDSFLVRRRLPDWRIDGDVLHYWTLWMEWWTNNLKWLTMSVLERATPSWSFSVWPARHRRTWQTTVSSPPTSARADSDQPTQRRASSDDQITVSVTDVLRLLDHVCGTRCRLIYGCDSLEQFQRLLKTYMFGAWDRGALWRLVRSVMYKSSYLLTQWLLWLPSSTYDGSKESSGSYGQLTCQLRHYECPVRRCGGP